jgi:hypothetical protein
VLRRPEVSQIDTASSAGKKEMMKVRQFSSGFSESHLAVNRITCPPALRVRSDHMGAYGGS